MRTAVMLVVAFAPAALAPARGQAPEGFTPLFDGKSLAGWRPVNTKDNFLVRDGVLVMNKGAGWLATEKTYADFELRVVYRFVTPGTDSGIFIRSALEGKNWTGRGYQVQNMDNATLGAILGMGVKVKAEHKKAELERLKKPTGEWMELKITALGTAGRVELDGAPIATSDDLQIREGHIGLQAEGGILEFRRIDLRPLAR